MEFYDVLDEVLESRSQILGGATTPWASPHVSSRRRTGP